MTREKGLDAAVAPHSTYTCSRQLISESAELAEEKNTVIHTHLSETQTENDRVDDQENARPLEVLDQEGALDSRTVLAHCVHLEDEEIQRIAESGASVVHNPSANLKLGSGKADVPEMIETGVNVALGTDGAASNNSLNMFEEMKVAALIHKESDPSSITAQQVLDMATINGAKALELNSGRIQPGFNADIAVVDSEVPEMQPLEDGSRVVSHLVYSFSGPVHGLYVNGRKVR
jgi:5-methylthioadenosine/S-adenosylhomocysteine deaminase